MSVDTLICAYTPMTIKKVAVVTGSSSGIGYETASAGAPA